MTGEIFEDVGAWAPPEPDVAAWQPRPPLFRHIAEQARHWQQAERLYISGAGGNIAMVTTPPTSMSYSASDILNKAR